MNRDMRQALKEKICNEKKRLLERIEGIDQGLHQSLSSSISELSVYDNHPGDIGSEVFERSKDFALRENAMTELRAIDHALESIEKGTYGRCEICGGEISTQRLEAIPYTTLCLHCKKEDEESPRTENRPVEEEVMEDVYARPFDDEENNTAFDWEDSFQEVARWNEHAVMSKAGSYYGGGEPVEEDERGLVEDVEGINYEVGDDGVIYQRFRSVNDEDSPSEVIDVGNQHNSFID